MNEAYLCLGGNLGDVTASFQRALALLEDHRVFLRQKSMLYESPAWGMVGSPEFCNQVCRAETFLGADQLMEVLLAIETLSGRVREKDKSYASRTLDMDIIFFDSMIIKTELLEVPHPRMHLRRFVLEPMKEIAPFFVHPVLQKTITQLLEECPDEGQVKKLSITEKHGSK